MPELSSADTPRGAKPNSPPPRFTEGPTLADGANMAALGGNRGWVGWIIAVAFLAAGFLVFGPHAVGGPLTYVTTRGDSMEPRMHQGDLVTARKASDYKVGDVIAYRDQQLLNQVVLHRIVSQEGDTFTRRAITTRGWIRPIPSPRTSWARNGC